METLFTENLFSYGTLQSNPVQQKTFGRTVEGSSDMLIGYSLEMLEIKDKDVIASSGLVHHPIIKYTGNSSDIIKGVVLRISTLELKQADDYEVDSHVRVSVQLKLGINAWVYISRQIPIRS